MKGSIIDFSIGFNRKQRITLEVESDFREEYERLKDKPLEIQVKAWRNKRTKDENAYFHVLVSEIARKLHMSESDCKTHLVLEYGVPERDINGDRIVCMIPASADTYRIWPYMKLYDTREMNGIMCNCYMMYKRTSDMNTEEMANLISGAIDSAQELGIDTDTPERKSIFEREN